MRCVVLLRGVNVGGHNRLPMAAFRLLLEDVGCRDVRTYVQSGNAAVEWPGAADALADVVHRRLVEELGLDVQVMVRTQQELDAVVSSNPFAGEPLDPTLLHVVFLDGAAPALDVESLLPDRVMAGDGVLYVAYAADAHSSKAAKLLSSKRFPVPATARNWRTVLALRDLCIA